MKEVIAAIHEVMPHAVIESQFNGAYVKLQIKDVMFNGMKMLEKHRFVKSILAPWIDDGTIHALELVIEGIGE